MFKTYLVGGAVRDELLNLPVTERDYVVVGASVEALKAQGFVQVGKDFPVFLHPVTKEEYALARTEKKTSQGYYGFECQFAPTVTLEEDLMRRDLTINAIARDESGRLIDPYGGRNDLEARVLRHVSDAFVEDPVRVLRVARFAARLSALGFVVAPETLAKMREVMLAGELKALIPSRVWLELVKALQTPNPEVFFEVLRAAGALKVIFPEIDALFGVPNPKKHHREICSGVHTLLVLKAAAALSPLPEVRFGALLHDLGKALTPIGAWPKHHGHDEAGVGAVQAFCKRLLVPNDFRDVAVLATRYHLILHRIDELKPATVVKYLERMDVFRKPKRFSMLLLIAKADAMGCLREEMVLGQGQALSYRQVAYPQLEHWRTLVECLAQIDPRSLIEEGMSGENIKERLHQARVMSVKNWQLKRNQNEK